MVDPEVWAEVSHLHARFAWGIDIGQPELAANQFLEDGVLIVPSELSRDAPPLIYRGRDAIRGRWENRSVVSRHAFVNLWLEPVSVDELTGKIMLLGYRAADPGFTDTSPVVISDFDDRIVRDQSGRWKFAERRGTIVFARAGP
jgi:hypothetical protein